MTGTDFIAQNGVRLVQMAKEIAGRFGLPIMVHLGDRLQKVPPTMTAEYLPLLEKGDTIVEVSAAFGTHSRYNAEYSYVFKVDGDGGAVCDIVVLEFGEPLEFIVVIIDGPIKKTVWSDAVFHGSRVPDMDWSARLR